MFARRLLSLLSLAVALLCAGPSLAGDRSGPIVHTIYRGQTIGMIAKRYNVTIDAICAANEIRRTKPIKPGQKLVIPTRRDKDGSEAKKARARLLGEGDEEVRSSNESKGTKKEKSSRRAKKGKAKIHTVYRGQTLGMIARRYGVDIGAICHANEIRRNQPIKPGQKLVIPAPGDEDGKEARQLKASGVLEKADESRSSRKSWRRYKKPAWRRGYIVLQHGGSGKRWRGYVIGPKSRLLPRARQRISDVLASWRTGKRVDIHPRLIRIIARVSDTFGGRPIRVVSGFREHSHSPTSRHPGGRALDFSVVGVPNWAVRDYLRTLSNVGVGFYPNSTFVHVDVREVTRYWVDYSRPGHAPRYAKTPR